MAGASVAVAGAGVVAGASSAVAGADGAGVVVAVVGAGAVASERGKDKSSSVAPAAAAPSSSILEVTLCLSGGADGDDRAEWPAEAGGYVCYMTSDEELLTLPVKRNALSLVLKEPGVMSFVKLVTARAEGPRYDERLHFLIALRPPCAF